MSDPAKVREAVRPNTKLVWLETPSNPMSKVFDIAAIAEVAKKAGIPLADDNTFAAPMLQRASARRSRPDGRAAARGTGGPHRDRDGPGTG